MKNDKRPDACDACQYPTTELMPVPPEHYVHLKTTVWLCRLCYNTMTSNTAIFPGQRDSAHAEILQTICYVGNVILAAIKANTKGGDNA